MLMLMSALAHISFMALFGGFLLVVRNAGEEAGGDMSAVRSRPEVGTPGGGGGRQGGWQEGKEITTSRGGSITVVPTKRENCAIHCR